jgi:hypothetical protein
MIKVNTSLRGALEIRKTCFAERVRIACIVTQLDRKPVCVAGRDKEYHLRIREVFLAIIGLLSDTTCRCQHNRPHLKTLRHSFSISGTVISR